MSHAESNLMKAAVLASLEMKRLFAPARPRGLVLTACLLAGLAVSLVLLSRQSRPAPFLVLHRPFSTPLSLRDRLDRRIPLTPSWAWVWRLEDKLLGRRKTVNIHADILMLPDPTRATLLSSQVLASPNFRDASGLQVWLLDGAELKALRDRFRQTPGIDFLGRPRITTADGVEASMYVGGPISLNGSTTDVGLKLDCFARVHSKSTDLFVNVTVSEALTNLAVTAAAQRPAASVSIQTNLDIAARLQIPKGSGALLLNSTPGEANHRVFGALIDPP